MSYKNAKNGLTRKTGRMRLPNNPPKPVLQLAVPVHEVKMTLTQGMDGVWRCWDADGKRVPTSTDTRLMVV